MQAHGLSFSVPGTPAAAAAARRRVMSDLRSWSVQFDAQSLHNVELVTSELITNAVQHAGVTTSPSAPGCTARPC